LHERLKQWNAQTLGYQINGTKSQHNKSPEYHDMQDSRPEIAGLSLLHKAIGDEVPHSSADGGETWVILASPEELGSSINDKGEKAQAYDQNGPRIGITWYAKIGFGGWMKRIHWFSLLSSRAGVREPHCRRS